MLSKVEVENIARSFLLENKYPISEMLSLTFPEESDNNDINEYLTELNVASVSFKSQYYDQRDEYPLDPGIYIVYVNLETGEVHMPRHM